MNGLISSITLFILTFSSVSWALHLRLPDRAYQGDLIVGKVEPKGTVFLKGKEQPVSDRGYFIIGVPRIQKTDLLISAIIGKNKVSKIVRILAYKWKIQRIDGLPKRLVNPPPEALIRIKNDNQMVRKIRQSAIHPAPLFLKDGFIPPLEGTITGVYGSQRILNGQPRSPHRGVDFVAAKGTPVVSPANGIVRLVAKDMYLMGNTLMIDHGLGLMSIFIHLDSISAGQGDRVQQGEIVARVGQTGRATGPHLHWGISVGSISIDPVRLLSKENLIPHPDPREAEN
ncbi:Peptidase, M23/M37 family [Olavius sp. associated proteobacterium Delta 1]|nr:Peptidase, M23/M37 family [Olavius sp. associated proteobacterium Delta 1]